MTVSVITLDRDFARLAEPYAPTPDRRLAAVGVLANAAVPVGVIASPVLPLLTDSRGNLELVASAAKQAGAESFFAGVLFLKPAAQRVFFPFLAEHFPHYLEQYEASYRTGAYLRGEYPSRIVRVVREIRHRMELAARDFRYVRTIVPPQSQLSLF